VDVDREGKANRIEAGKLLLDVDNPRFGELEKGIGQASVLDMIVERFGVEDVLSSLSINGFFSAEPLVCRASGNGSFTVVEGNRRLAASLIILGDQRASNQGTLHQRFSRIWADHGNPTIDPIPVIEFEGEKPSESLLAYLGVRHIASAQPWDSYAKAAWVSRITNTTSLSVVEVSAMIGDQHRTVLRLLEGYNFVRQAIRENVFDPEQSVRKGRGSVTEFPFSWVYTFLGYKTARAFLGLPEITPKVDPIDPTKIGNAGLVLSALFGDSKRGRNSAVTDSREISDLANVFSDPQKISLLREGKNIEEIDHLTKPIEKRLEENLGQVRNLLANLSSGLAASPPTYDAALLHHPTSRQVRGLATDVEKKLNEIISGDGQAS
jgi:hypothetical protein